MTGTWQTNGLIDLVGRRATWGDKPVRVVDVDITPKRGGVAIVQIVGRQKTHRVPVDKLRLVPKENMPSAENRQEDIL